MSEGGKEIGGGPFKKAKTSESDEGLLERAKQLTGYRDEALRMFAPEDLQDLVNTKVDSNKFKMQHEAKEAAAVDPLVEEKQLHEKLMVYGRAAYEEDFLSKYMSQASTFELSYGNENAACVSTRPAEFRVFLGPSGSGKTFSAIKRDFVGFSDNSEFPLFCTLYMTVASAWDPEKSGTFIDQIEQTWKRAMPDKRLKMLVHVVIDEAGFQECTTNSFSWSVRDFTALQHRLQNHATKVIISAAGTNLEKVVGVAINSSSPDLRKYRAKPWTREHVLALVPEISATYVREENLTPTRAQELVEKWLDEVPIFATLTGNGRAGVRLVRVLLEMCKQSRNPKDNVAEVVDSVSKAYIGDNGLHALDIYDRRRVVKAVLKVLKAEDVESPEPVQFQIESELEKHCHGFVDSNIDKTSDAYRYLDESWKCPCKVSACLTIVMFDLLGFTSKLSTNWESFEGVCILTLIQQTIIKTDTKTEFELIQMKAAFPPSSAAQKAEVPLIGTHDVVLNGPRASHGDVFGNFTIIQSKPSMNYEKVECKLYEELYKSGLAKPDDDNDGNEGASVHAAITALLHLQWSSEDFKEPNKSPLEKKSATSPARNFMYPASLLETSQVVDYKVIEINKNEFRKWEIVADSTKRQLKVPAQFNQRITFAVCTNTETIELNLRLTDKVFEKLDPDYADSQDAKVQSVIQLSKSILTLYPNDVDTNGELLAGQNATLIEWINMVAKGGVDVRFRFCRG